MPVASREIGEGIWLVHATGRLDAHAVPDLEAAFAALPAEGLAGVVVDLSDATYISSSGLKLISTAWRRQRGQGRQLVPGRSPGRACADLRDGRLHPDSVLFDDVAAARNACAPPPAARRRLGAARLQDLLPAGLPAHARHPGASGSEPRRARLAGHGGGGQVPVVSRCWAPRLLLRHHPLAALPVAPRARRRVES
jgi:anti-anti-sigma factor